MKTIATALAAFVLAAVFFAQQPAEARCWWNGYRWHCSHYRHWGSHHRYWRWGYHHRYWGPRYAHYYRPYYGYYRPYYCFPAWPFCG